MITRRNYAAVFYDGKARLQQYTPINNFNMQGISKGLLDIISLEMERFYDGADYLSKTIDPTRAVGLDLENIGYLMGERRASGANAGDFTTSNFYFYIDPKIGYSAHSLIEKFYSAAEIQTLVDNNLIVLDTSTQEYSIRIPNGTTVSNTGGSVSYTTTGDVFLTGTNDSYIGITSVASGPSSNVETNVLITHSIFQIPELRKIARYIKCTNSFPIQNGTFSQSDEQLRYKISTKGSAYQGNELFMRRTALQTPGIRDILFEKNKFGAGTVHIIIDAVSPLASEGLIAAVKQNIQNTASYGDIIFVSRPEYLGVEINFTIQVEPGTVDPLSIRNQVRNAMIQYINDLPIGGEIVWNRLVSIALDTSGVVDFIPNYFKYGTYDIVNKVNKEQVVLRFINQKARYTEKFYTDSGLMTCCVA